MGVGEEGKNGVGMGLLIVLNDTVESQTYTSDLTDFSFSWEIDVE